MNKYPSLDVVPISTQASNEDIRFAPTDDRFSKMTEHNFVVNNESVAEKINNSEELVISKFDTCIFRSKDLQERVIKRCSCKGGDMHLQGYYCSAKDLFQVTPEICKTCELHKTA